MAPLSLEELWPQVRQDLAARYRAVTELGRPSAAGSHREFGVHRWVYGMGFYSAPPRVLQAIRDRALAAPECSYAAAAPHRGPSPR